MNIWEKFNDWLTGAPSRKEFRQYWESQNGDIINSNSSEWIKNHAFEKDYSLLVMQKQIETLEKRIHELESRKT